MKRAGVLVIAVLTFVAVTFFASPAEAEFEAPQRSAWGLAEPFTDSNAVGRFSALGWAVEEHNNQMYVGGKFQNVTNGQQTVGQPNFARFSLAGQWDSGFTPDVTEPVLTIANSPDGALFVGGELGSYNGIDVGALTKIDPATGEVWPGWNLRLSGSTSVVREVTIESDGWAYAVGSFNGARFNGVTTPVTNVVRFNPLTGEPDTSWTPVVVGGSVWDVSVSRVNNSVYLGGWFTSVAGVDNTAVGVDTNDHTNITWGTFEHNGSGRGLIYGVEATEFGDVWVAGEQHGVWVHDENNNYNLIREHLTNCHRILQGGDCTRRGGEFQEIERVGDRIYITCHCWGHHASGDGRVFTPYPGELQNISPDAEVTGSVSGIVAYSVATGDRDQSFNPYMAGDIGGFGVAQASDGCLWTTGGFNAVGNPADGPQTPGRDLVRLCDGGGNAELAAPASCSAVLNGTNIEVTWPSAAGATDYVVRRSVNGNGPHWRGKVSGLSFSDSSPSGTLAYFVESKNAAGESSSRTACSFDDENAPLEAPANCSAVVDGADINVTWPAAGGASDYVVRRSVDGNGPFWRGRVSNTSFTDSNRSGNIEYTVESRSALGEISSRTQCSFDPGAEPQPVASCSASLTNGVVTISWPAQADASRYVVYRTFNGGNQFWRGAVDAPATSFSDSDRQGTLEYAVSARYGNTVTDRVTCTPTI